MISGCDYAVSINGHPDLASAQFAFLKATEGTSTTEAGFAGEAARVRGLGLVLGAYHFGWPIEDATAQAEHFVSTVQPIAGDILWLDFEGYPDDRNWQGLSWAQRDAWRLAWIAKVRQLVGGRNAVGTYCNTSTWLAIPSDDPGDALWIAEYGVAAPQIQHPWLFWQSGQSAIDQDVGQFTNAGALRTWALSFQPAPTPTPAPTPPAPHYSEDTMLSYLPPIEAGATVDLPVEPAGTLTAPQGGAKNGPLWLALTPQGQGGAVSVAMWAGGKLGAATSHTVTVGSKTVIDLPSDGTVDAVRVTTDVPLYGYLVGRQVA